LLNAVPFTEDREVFEHLRDLLPSWNELPPSLKVSTPPKVRFALERGHVSNLLLKFTNDEDVEVSILEVRFESQGVELTDPLTPDSPNLWQIPPHLSRTFGKSIVNQRNRAVGLLRMNPNEGIFFNAELDVVFSCSVNRQIHEIRKKLFVKVNVTSNVIVQLT